MSNINENVINNVESREDVVDKILFGLGNLSSSPLNSSGIIKLNLKSDDLRYFTFGKSVDELFGKRNYVEILFSLLQRYVNYVKYESNSERDEFSAYGLMEYIDKHLIIDNPNGSDYSWLCSLLPKGENYNEEAVADAFHIVLMIVQSMFSGEERVYQQLNSFANDVDRRNSIISAFLESKSTGNVFYK